MTKKRKSVRKTIRAASENKRASEKKENFGDNK